jgi:hypothetical protein
VIPFETPFGNFLSLVASFALVLVLQGTLGFKLAIRPDSGLLTSALMLGVLIFALLVVLVAAAFTLAAQLLLKARRPTLRLASNGEEPVLTLPEGCAFSAFCTHTWGTGQDQAHALVRQLQLLLPGVQVRSTPTRALFVAPRTILPRRRPQIWLDVDLLDDVGRLEESVGASACVIIFLSRGYFESAATRL